MNILTRASRPASRRHGARRLLTATLATCTMSAGVVGVGAVIDTAAAHTGNLPVTAKCNTVTGEYDFTAKLTLSNVPDNKIGTTKWRTGPSTFEGTPNSDANMNRGPISTTGNTTVTLVGTDSGDVKFSLPGTTTGLGPWFYAFTKWSGASAGSDGQLKDSLKGDCKSTPPKVEIPAKPSVNDPCGLNNATWNVPADTDKIDWTLRPDGHLIAETKTGLKFTDGTTSKDYGVVKDSDELCPPTKINIPASPGVLDPCGPNNATWNVPANTDTLKWTLKNDGHLTVSIIKENTVFTDGTTSKDYGVVKDTGVPCPPTKIEIPKKAEQNDPCGINNATWIKPQDTDVVKWMVDRDGKLIVTIIKENTVFTDGTTTHNYGVPKDSNELCPPTKIDIPAAPSSQDPCGPNNATWNVPTNTDMFKWERLGNGHLTVSIIKENTVFTDGTTSKDFGVVKDSGELCPVTTPPPVVNEPAKVRAHASRINKCGLKGDYVALRKSTGVKYTVNGRATKKSIVPTQGKKRVVVKAYATSRTHVLVGKKAWTFKFTNKPCKTTPYKAPPTGK